MACSNPARSFYMGVRPDGKEDRIYVRDHNIVAVNVDSAGHRKYFYDTKSLPQYGRTSITFDDVPCGKCLGCRLLYAREKSWQCLEELQTNPGPAYFVTFTYDNQHLPRTVKGSPTLHYRDMQLFFKRCRKAGHDVRYMCCSEYGGQTLRPHYHAIIFGLELPDLVATGVRNAMDQPYFTSDYLDKLWSNGHCLIGECTADSCGYVARYASKALENDKLLTLCFVAGLEKPKLRVSKSPPLGHDFVLAHAREFLDNGSVSVSTSSGGKQVRLTRSACRILDKHFPDEFRACKFSRLYSLECLKTAVKGDWYEYLENNGKALEVRTVSLQRKKV